MIDRVEHIREAETERAWAEELRRRIQAVRSGEMGVISEEEADAEAERFLADEDAAQDPSSGRTSA
jgi:hypothetical protein